MDKSRSGRYQRISRHLITSLLLGASLAPFVLLESCHAQLSHSILRDIEWERNDWQRDSRAVDRTVKLLQAAVASSPKLFEGTNAPEEWQAKLSEAKNQLNQSERDDRRLS